MSNTPGAGDAGMDMGAGADESFDLSEVIGDAFDEITAAGTGAEDEHDAAAAPSQAAPQPSPQNATETPAASADKAPATPDRWTPQEQAAFDALPPETKALVEKRVASATAEYQQKAALADEVSAVVTPEFQQVLDNSGMTVGQGVAYLANMERFASSQPAEYLAFVANHVQSMGVDVAAVLGLGGAPAPQGQQPQEGAGSTDPNVSKLEQRLSAFERNFQQQAQREKAERANSTIASVRDAKDAAGKPLRPHFAAVEQDMARLIKANPQMTLEQAYDAAVWSNPTVRAELQKAERDAALQAQRDEATAARRAVRGNVRGGGRSMEASPNIKTTEDAVNAAMDAVGL